jgi:L-lactate permease
VHPRRSPPVPIVVLFVMLGVLRKPSWMAALSALGSALLIALFGYGMPAKLALISAIYGAAYGLFPIAWVVFSSIMMYRLAVDTGKFEIIKDSVGSLTDDRRLQAMFIAFSFGAFIEGAAGFGAPVAVSGAMLAGLGFNPFYAAGICLLANTAPVAFGSIGIPVTTLANVTGLPVMALSAMIGRLCAMMSVIIPGYLIVVMAGPARARSAAGDYRVRRLVRRHAVLRVEHRRPELTDIMSSLTCIIVMVVVLKVWRPETIMRLEAISRSRARQSAMRAARSSRRGSPTSCSWHSSGLGRRDHQAEDQSRRRRVHPRLAADCSRDAAQRHSLMVPGLHNQIQQVPAGGQAAGAICRPVRTESGSPRRVRRVSWPRWLPRCCLRVGRSDSSASTRRRSISCRWRW